MSVMTAADIASRSGGRVEGDTDAACDGWAFDSRAIEPGSCFVALRGSRDGHDFVASAFGGGATIALVDHDPAPSPLLDRGRALVRVDDTLRALQDVARSIRNERDVKVVAVAGSTGKTSTKDLLAAALAPRGCHANDASYNNEFGLPLTFCNAPAAASVIVTEMGERFPGDLALLCDIARPHVAVVTGVGLAHAEHLGGPQGVAEVLAELTGALPPDGVLVLPHADPWTPFLASRTAAAVVTVGTERDATCVVSDVRLDDRLHPSFDFEGTRISVQLHGAHHASNAALAAAVAHRVFGMSVDEIAVELAGATVGRWRMELLEADDGLVVVNDAYNANPTSVHAALVALADLPVKGQRIAVLGEMRELGAHHESAHCEIGEHAARLGIDLVVGVGEGGALIAGAAGAAGASTKHVDSASAAVDVVDAIATAGDAVLCKASRAVGLEHVAEELLSRRRVGRRGGVQ